MIEPVTIPLGEGATLHDGAWTPVALPTFTGRIVASLFLNDQFVPVDHEIAQGRVTIRGKGAGRYLVVCEGGQV